MKHLKEEFDKLTFKEALLYGVAIACLIGAFVLLFWSMMIAPKGEIHDSVLTAFALVLFFVGALLGIDLKYQNKTEALQKMVTDFLKARREEEKLRDENISA